MQSSEPAGAVGGAWPCRSGLRIRLSCGRCGLPGIAVASPAGERALLWCMLRAAREGAWLRPWLRRVLCNAFDPVTARRAGSWTVGRGKAVMRSVPDLRCSEIPELLKVVPRRMCLHDVLHCCGARSPTMLHLRAMSRGVWGKGSSSGP